MRRSIIARYGPLTLSFNGKRVPVESVVKPMVPANHLTHDPAKLRSLLDELGYLYFAQVVPREAALRAAEDIELQMEANGWTTEKLRQEEVERHGVAWGITAPQDGQIAPPTKPFAMTNAMKEAICGAPVMTSVRNFFGGPVTLLSNHTLDLSYPGEQHGFSMPGVFMNRGTKLVVTAWTPLVDVQLRCGPLVVVAGSNRLPSWARVRHTYGQHDVEYDGIAGDGSYSTDVDEILALGGELHTTSFQAGDVVLSTCYTMQTFAVNESRQWRVSGTSRWIMEGDDAGPDDRYKPNGVGLDRWFATRGDPAKYPKSMEAMKKEWAAKKI